MVEIKRFRFGEKGESTDHHRRSIDTANALVLLSQSEKDVMSTNHRHQHKRVFECKSCGKQFSSFQALGGHRASHKRPRLADDDRDRAQIAMSKPKMHECSVCGLEFAMGQALGGHMRRHRASNDQGSSHGKRGLCLDLNLAPSGYINTEGPELELGLGARPRTDDRTPITVEFFH